MIVDVSILLCTSKYILSITNCCVSLPDECCVVGGALSRAGNKFSYAPDSDVYIISSMSPPLWWWLHRVVCTDRFKLDDFYSIKYFVLIIYTRVRYNPCCLKQERPHACMMCSYTACVEQQKVSREPKASMFEEHCVRITCYKTGSSRPRQSCSVRSTVPAMTNDDRQLVLLMPHLGMETIAISSRFPARLSTASPATPAERTASLFGAMNLLLCATCSQAQMNIVLCRGNDARTRACSLRKCNSLIEKR